MKIIQSEPSDSAVEITYRNCYLQQIHLLGHIQPHGILLGLKEPEMEIVQISDNTLQFFNIPAKSLLNKPLSVLFSQSQVNNLLSFVSHKDLEIFNPIELTAQIKRKKYLFQGLMHRSDGLLILELEPLIKDIDSNIDFYHLSKLAAVNVRKAQDFGEMTNLLVQEIQKITEYDRVLIYKCDSDGSGEVIAEAKSDEHLESFLGLHYPASDISDIARQLYCKNWLRIIVDINYQPVPIIPSQNPVTHKTLDLSLSILRSVSHFHVKYLQKLGVSASLGISLINADKLWGLIVCHHYSPKYIGYETRKACEFLGQIMSVEIVNKHEQYLKKAQQNIKVIQAKLKQNILDSYQSDNHQNFIQDTNDLLELVNAEGAVICLGDRLSLVGQCPEHKCIHDLVAWLDNRSQDILHTNALSEIYPEAIALKDVASGLLAISILLHHTSYHIIWFRPEVIQTVNWAGDPKKLLNYDEFNPIDPIDDDEFNPSPYRSFALWKETVRGQSLPWDEVEIEAALELRSTLMLAALEFSQQALKEEAKRSEVANQAKSSFLARMSHELRTPLNAILGCTQLIAHEQALTSDIGEYVNIISYSSEHLLNLIDDVLEVSKIEAGKIVLEETEFDLHLLLNNLQEMLQIKARGKKLQLIFAIHPSLPQYIKTDDRKVRQILLNLLGNAIKFTSKGYVILRASLESIDPALKKATIHFEIEDTGRGIAPEEINSLFEAFVQTASGRESQTGTGLGLVISQQFAHFMGGHITASSTLGKGSIFQFDIAVETLPNISKQELNSDNSDIVVKEDNISQESPESVFSPTNISKEINLKKPDDMSSKSLRILLAEDNSFNQMIALRLLDKLGYKADCAVNGLDVLRVLEQKSYDLILMDIQMPEMDGLEATRQIRLKEKNDAVEKIKIVAMTANAMAADREKCLLIGMDDFISKPVRMDDLAMVLKKFS